MRKDLFLWGTAALLIFGSAYGHGLMTNRWGAPPDLAAAAAKLDQIPLVMGEWQGQDRDLPETQLQAAEAVGAVSRIYRNEKLQAEVQLLVLCGPHGPIAVHPPTVCFAGAGLYQVAPEKSREMNAGKVRGTFWETVFTIRTPEGVTEELETFWAWSVAGECQAAENPRVEYAAQPHLYKIYVTHLRPATTGNASPPPADNPVEAFLQDFLPTFQKALADSDGVQ